MELQDVSLKPSLSPATPSSDDRIHSQTQDITETLAFIPAPGRSFSRLASKHSTSFRTRLRRLFDENTGLLLISLSQLFGSCMSASVQTLNKSSSSFHPTEILIIRQSITWSFTYLYMRYRNVSDPLLGPTEVRYLLAIRGTAGFCGVFSTYYALQYLSLSDAIVLTFISPFFTSFAGTFFLGETFSNRNFFAGVFSLVGVVLIARPEALFGPSYSTSIESKGPSEKANPRQRLMAVAISMLGVLGASGAYVSLRAIGKRAHTLHSMNYFALFSGVLSVLLMILGRIKPILPHSWWECLLLLAISFFGFNAQMLLIMGLRRETASRGSLAMYIQIVFASILDRVLFHVTPSLLSLGGTFIILGSGIYVGLTKETSNTKTIGLRRDRISCEANLDGPEEDVDIEEQLHAYGKCGGTPSGEEGMELRERDLVLEGKTTLGGATVPMVDSAESNQNVRSNSKSTHE